MKRFVLFAAIAVAILNRVNLASAAELPTYELTGFPGRVGPRNCTSSPSQIRT